MLEEIDKIKRKEQKQKLDEIFEESKNKSGPDLEEAINNAEEEMGSEAYEDNKEKIREMKEKKAAENFADYKQKTREKLRKNMRKEGINKQDFEDKEAYEKLNNLNNTEINDANKFVELETKVAYELEKVKAKKNLNKIIDQINSVLASRFSQSTIEEVKTKVLEFISNPNIYCQSAYNNRKPEVQNLLSKLENYSTSERPNGSDGRFPLNVVLPITAVLLLAIVLGVIFVWQKNKKRY